MRTSPPVADPPRRAARVAVCAALLGGSTASATVPDTMGLGYDRMSMGGAGVSIADDGAAAVLNPAGLGRVRRPTLTLGGLWGKMDLTAPPPVWWDTNRDGTVDERDPPLRLDDGVDDLAGLHLTLSRHLGGRFGFGVAIYTPAQRLFRLDTFEPALPTYVQYRNRLQRYQLAAGVGGEVLPGVRLGVAVDVVPRVKFSVGMVADITVTADEEAEDLGQLVTEAVIDVNEVRLDIVPGFAPVIGLQLDLGRWHRALDGLRIGAAWRGEVGVPVTADLDVQANIRTTQIGEIDPVALAAVIDADLFLYDHYVPMKVDVGLSYTRAPWIELAADVRWTNWRRMLLSVARVQDATLTTPLFDLGDVIVDGNDHEVQLRGTVSVRAGGSVSFPRVELKSRARYVAVSTSAGGGFEPTPLVAQGPDSALLDAGRWWLAGGLRVETWDPFRMVNGPIHLGAFFQLHRLLPRALDHASDTPRPGFSRDGQPMVAGGSMLVIGGELGFEY